MFRSRTLLGAALAACLALTPGVMPSASASGDTASYASGGTAVARVDGQPVVDEGTVVCDDGNGVGAGGFCLEFGGGDAVHVLDQMSGENVAFQVCLDNNGDGVCTSPDNTSFCPDQVFFSHDDAGNFFNPVGPLPTGFTSGCAGGPWKGYVVLLCEGVHADGVSAHQHAASSGTGTVTSGGEGLGTFCGGGPQPSRKPYKVGSGARYVSGGTAASRKDGQTVADEGTVQCNGGDNAGVGGFCTSFGAGDAMAVFDDVSGTDVAFQVCVDNSGDGICTSPDNRSTCADVVIFSHDDAGNFYNPVGPLPTGFSSGCGAGAWDGYVVFLCEGTHVNGGSGHAHPATSGSGRVTTGGEGVGTFCGGSHAAPSNKRYRLGTQDQQRPCRAQVFADPSGQAGQPGTFTGGIEGGPITAGDVGAPPAAQITLTCELKVNDVTKAVANGSGVGAVSPFFEPVQVFTTAADSVTICAFVTFDGATRSLGCEDVVVVDGPADVNVPPQEVRDVVNQIVATGCASLALRPVALTIQGHTVVVTQEGDVFVDSTQVLECGPPL